MEVDTTPSNSPLFNSRMDRKTLSFSKKLYMLYLHFKLWAFQYNQQLIS